MSASQPSTEVLVYEVDELAKLLRVSPRTIGALLRNGSLIRRKIGARTVIPKYSVERFLRRDHTTRPKKAAQQPRRAA
jgi:excisionase family DNA binding protein